MAIGFAGGFTIVACELIFKSKCPFTFFMVLFYPITGLIASVYAMHETRKLPASVLAAFFGSYCELLGGIWINCSPKQCLR